MTTLHIADRPDQLAIDAEWRKEWAELMVPMTFRLRSLKHHFAGAGDGKTFDDIYNGTVELRADLDALKQRQTSILDKLEVNRDAWHDAVSARSGRLEELDAQVNAQKRDMSSNQGNIRNLENQRRELEGSVSSLQDEISWAKSSLKTTQDQELVLTQTSKDNAINNLSDSEQNFKHDILVWKRQVEKASNEQQLRQLKLQEMQDSLEERRLALVEAEKVFKTANTMNDEVSNQIKSARAILQSLANGVGSTADTTSTLIDLDVLATVINKRFLNLQRCYGEKKKVLAACEEHTSEVEDELQSTIRRLEELTGSLEQRTEQLEVLKEMGTSIPTKHLPKKRILKELNEEKGDLSKGEGLQGAQIAKNKQFAIDLTGNDGQAKDLNTQLSDLQRVNTDELKQLKIKLVEKDDQIMMLNHKYREDISELQQDLAKSRSASSQKNRELKDLRLQLEEARTSITSVASTNRDIKNPQQQNQDLHETATHINSGLNNVTLDLSGLRRNPSAEIRDLHSMVTRHANHANGLRKQLHKLQQSSEAESRRLQQDLESKRVMVGEFSRKIKQQKENLDENQVQIREQEAKIACKEKELARTKKAMEDMGRSMGSGMDQLECERDEAEKERDEVEEKLKDLEEELSEVQEWLKVSQEEVRKLEARNASTRQAGTNKQVLTRLQTRPSPDGLVDQDDEMLDQSVNPQTTAPPKNGRKRKSADMASDGEEADTHDGNRLSAKLHTTAEPADLQQDSTTSRSATWSIDDMRNPTYVPDPPIPATVLTKLREKMLEWDKTPRGWTKFTAMHRCVEVRVKKTKTEWPHGEGYRCGHCTKYDELCVIVEKDARITMLPSYHEPGKPVGINTEGYWMGQIGISHRPAV